jgi:hypothetical protein
MFARHRAGEVVDSQDPAALADAFMKLVTHAECYRDNAVRLAQADFDPDTLIGRVMGRFGGASG